MKLLLAVLCALPLLAQVAFEKKDGAVAVTIDGKPFTTFYYATDAPKPYLYPLLTASGRNVARGFPMEQIEGESKDHPHHRGLFFGHGDVNGCTFWDNETVNRTPHKGLIRNGVLLKAVEGKQQGVLVSRFDWLSDSGEKLLTEERVMTFSSQPGQPGQPGARILDLDFTFTAAVKTTFGDTKEGTFAIRLADKLAEKGGTGKMINAEGLSGMAAVWGKPSPWVDYTGTLGGETVGVTILDHPGNPKHPTYWHSRDYGLFAANPFGERDFLKDKTRNGALTIEPGSKLRFRYRVIIHGAVDAAQLAAWFKQY